MKSYAGPSGSWDEREQTRIMESLGIVYRDKEEIYKVLKRNLRIGNFFWRIQEFPNAFLYRVRRLAR